MRATLRGGHDGPRPPPSVPLAPLEPLDRLRRRLTGWYVATVGATLLVLGAGLFVAVARGIGAALDASLDRAVAVLTGALVAAPAGTDPAAVLRAVRIPDRSLYLLDGDGRLLAPDTASRWVREAAAVTVQGGVGTRRASIGGEHTLQVRAARATAHGRRYVVVAAADTEELEDAYTGVIAAFAAAALAALGLVAGGGAWLARKSTAPVAASVAHLRRFLADAAHELRTPVAVMRARADVTLAHGRDAATYAAAVRELRAETERLARILDDLFTLARAEAGERPIERRRVFLDDVALDAADAARALGAPCGVVVDVTAFDEAVVVGDAALIRQLLMTVLDNAVKYTPSGGRVTVAVAVSAGRPTVVVEDTGIGIPPAALPHVFERFYRADSARGRLPGGDAGGAGLGLAIARWIAEQHGADLTIAARPGGGTRVQVQFPPA